MASWSIPPVRVRQLLRDEMEKAARAIALEILNRIMVRSPVDTGRFRGNWQLDINVAALEALENFDKDGQATVMAQAAKLIGYKLGAVISIRNNLPYAVPLEYGHSGQAPNGMVRITVAEAPQIAKAVEAGLIRRRAA